MKMALLMLVWFSMWAPALADALDDEFVACDSHTHIHPPIFNGHPTGPFRPTTYDQGFEYCEKVAVAHEARQRARLLADDALAIAPK